MNLEHKKCRIEIRGYTKQCTFLLCILLAFTLYGCAASYGVKDSGAESQIIRANNLIGWYKDKNYSSIEKQLKADLQLFKGDSFAELRIMNELATLYTDFLFDLEHAIDLDRKILALQNSNPDRSLYFMEFSSANNRSLVDVSYKAKFISIDNSAIMALADKRLVRNQSLLMARPSGSGKVYSLNQLLTFKANVKSDLAKCYKGTPDYFEISSRLIRAEYELYRLTNDKQYLQTGYRMLLDGDIRLEDIYYSEIDFIALSDYLRFAYFKTSNEKLAEHSLTVIYKPYMNIRSHEHRWLYNQMVNNRINILIDAYFTKSLYDTMLYYISLNKSRMILEDKIKNIQNSNMKTVKNDYFETTTGLPKMSLFRKKLETAEAYLDFYVDGHYAGEKSRDGTRADFRSAYATAGDSGKTRRITLSDKGSGVFDSDFVYVTYLDKGKISAVRRNRSSLEELRKNYSGPVAEITSGKDRRIVAAKSGASHGASDTDLASFVGIPLPSEITVSPDGWLSSYPFSYLLDRNVTRTLNLFSYGHPDRVDTIKVVGYFNPTLDLPEAEQEKVVLEKLFSGSAQLFVRNQANLDELHKPLERNILHLSMHGMHNGENPDASLLAFAGSLKINNGIKSDRIEDLVDFKHALLARDMYSLSQLQNNDLVFTAACQTGLTAKGAGNESEIMGIMRPLLINNNRNIILTLWDVDSQSASEFVAAFYEQLAHTKNIRTSFYRARDTIKGKYPDPKHWAPYYLIQND